MGLVFKILGFLPWLLPFSMLFFLSDWFQNPDGAEMYFAAINNGVMHPPGYVVNGWINRFFLFLWKDPTSLSVQSFLFSYLSFITFEKILERSGVRKHIAITYALLFFFNPFFLSYSLQPTKYTFIIFSQLIVFYLLIREKGRDNHLLSSLSLGVAISAHLISLPLVLSWVFALKKRALKYFPIVILTFGLFQLSLFLQNGNLWPNWMPANSIGGISDLLSRKDIAQFNTGLLHSLFSGLPLNAFIQNAKGTFISSPLVYFLPFSFLFMLKNKKHVIYLFPMIATTLFLVLNNHPMQLNWMTQNERWGILVLPWIYLLPALFHREINNLLPFGILQVSLVLGVLSFGYHIDRIILNGFNFYHSFYHGLAKTDPGAGYWFDNSDETIMSGSEKGQFPLVAIKSSWYREKFVPEEIKGIQGPFFEGLFERGALVKSTNSQLMNSTHFPFHQNGLWFYSQINLPKPSPEMVLENSRKLCKTLASHTRDIPKEGHYYQKFIKRYFAQAFTLNSRQVGHAIPLKELSNSLVKRESIKQMQNYCSRL